METPGNRAGHLIRAKALGLCLRTWHRTGRGPDSWARVRSELAETFPEATTQSREAVVRVAMRMARQMEQRARHPKDWLPPTVIRTTELVRSRDRVRRKPAAG